MKNVFLIAGTLALVGGIALSVSKLAMLSSPLRSQLKANASEFAEASSPTIDPVSSDQQVIRRLQLERSQKEELNHNLSGRAMVASSAAAPVPNPPDVPGSDRIAQACDMLDERMLTAPTDGRSAAEMDRAIRAIADSDTLGQVKVGSLHCGGTMCRLNLEGDTDGSVDGATRSLAKRTPKLFAGISIFPTMTGKRAIYLAKSREDLRADEQE